MTNLKKKGVGTTFSFVLPVDDLAERADMRAEAVAELEQSEELG